MPEAGDRTVESRRSILVADDDPVCRAMLRPVLESWGYDVVEASDGQTAFEILSRESGPRLATCEGESFASNSEGQHRPTFAAVLGFGDIGA